MRLTRVGRRLLPVHVLCVILGICHAGAVSDMPQCALHVHCCAKKLWALSTPRTSSVHSNHEAV